MNAYFFLVLAIVFEVIATTLMKTTDGFTRLMPSIGTALGYVVSFYCLAQSLKTLPTGVAYAIWSAVGVVLISLAGWIFFKQKLDAAAIAGMGLIVCGVLVINLFSETVTH